MHRQNTVLLRTVEEENNRLFGVKSLTRSFGNKTSHTCSRVVQHQSAEKKEDTYVTVVEQRPVDSLLHVYGVQYSTTYCTVRVVFTLMATFN